MVVGKKSIFPKNTILAILSIFVLPHIPGTPNSFWRVFGDFRCKNNLY